MSEYFEWDAAKADANLRKHAVAFKDAKLIFDDDFAVRSLAVDGGDGEQRMLATGIVNGRALTVVYAERGDRTRLFSARKASKRERIQYYSSKAPS
jgi:uncharacterized DUF497 family protein